MTKALITESTLTAIADAIRAKGGASGTMTPAQMAAAITAIPSGGGDVHFPPGGANPEFLETHSETLTLAETDFPPMTMSTSQQVIKAAESGAFVSAYFPYARDAVVIQQAFCQHVYNGADGKVQTDHSYRIHYTYISRGKSTATGTTNRTATFTQYYLDYLNSSGARAYASGTYGIYGTCNSCSLSSSGSTIRVSISSPTWYGRVSSTYCKSANMNKLDTSATTLQWIVDVFTVDQHTTPLGYFTGDKMFEAFDAGSIGSLGG